MQLGGAPRPCCTRLIEFSFKRFNNGPLTYSYDEPDFDKENGGKPGESSNLSKEDQDKIMEDYMRNPDNWAADPNNNNNSSGRQTFQRAATFCDGTNKIERFGS